MMWSRGIFLPFCAMKVISVGSILSRATQGPAYSSVTRSVASRWCSDDAKNHSIDNTRYVGPSILQELTNCWFIASKRFHSCLLCDYSIMCKGIASVFIHKLYRCWNAVLDLVHECSFYSKLQGSGQYTYILAQLLRCFCDCRHAFPSSSM